jgi:serine/threonine protein kinase
MAPPTTVKDFLALTVQSGLVDEGALGDYSQRRQNRLEGVERPEQMAGLLVQDGLLTHFQAEQLLQGRWRRFLLGRYKVLDQLGSGGMGQVYLCADRQLGRRVAIKVLPFAKARQPSNLERFQREARAAAILNHPNIVRAYEVCQDDDLHYLVLEYVEGACLKEIVARQGPLSFLRAVQYMRQAASGLQHAYQNGLVHRDIKPANLLIDISGTLKILDLGLARFFQDETDDVSIKHNESVLGTVDYLAPEQAVNSHNVDVRADIYSLGCTFYYCLTGQPPFAEGTPAQKVIWHQSRRPRSIKAVRPDVPEGLLAIIGKAMAKDPADRYQTPAELIRELDALPLLTSETASSAADQTMTKREQWGHPPAPPWPRWPILVALATFLMWLFLALLLIRLFAG